MVCSGENRKNDDKSVCELSEMFTRKSIIITYAKTMKTKTKKKKQSVEKTGKTKMNPVETFRNVDSVSRNDTLCRNDWTEMIKYPGMTEITKIIVK